MKTSALIFAAGLGTRLYPLTADKPKALVTVNGKTLLESAIQKITEAGIDHIVVNVHHFADLIKEFIVTHSFNAQIDISDESELLRDTAGGLKYAQHFFVGSDHILLYNVDILSSINLVDLINEHIALDGIATLAVKVRSTSRYFIFDQESMNLCGWCNHQTGEMIRSRSCHSALELAFSGIHVIKKELIELIPTDEKNSLVPVYLSLSEKYNIKGYLHQNDEWKDVGKYDEVVKWGMVQ